MQPFFCSKLQAVEVDINQLRVGSLELFEVGGNSSQTKALLSSMKTKQGEFFSQEHFDEDLKVLANEFDRVEPKMSVSSGMLDIKILLTRRPIIHSITFSGNEAVTSEKLKKQLEIKAKSVFDRALFIKACNKVRAYYLKQGYFESEVSYQILPAQNGEIDIKLFVKEGRAGKIEEIRFTNFTDKEEQQLRELLFTKPYSFWLSWLTNDGIYNKENVDQDTLGSLSFLHDEGYADAKVTTKILPSENKERIVLEFTCERGELYKIGKVEVVGNRLFTKEQILDAINIKAGDCYSPDALRKASRAVYDLYGRKGYIDATANPDSMLQKESRIYDITFHINEGAEYRVGMIKIFGNNKTDSSVILHETLLIPGSVFDSTMIQKTEERLRNVGYFKQVNVYAVRASQLQPATTQNPTTAPRFRDVHIEVEEKPTTANFSAFGGYSTTEGLMGGLGISESNFRMMGFTQLFSKGMRALRGAGEYVGINAQVGTKQLSYNFSWTKPYFMDTQWILGLDLQKMRNSYSASDYTIKSESAILSAKYPINAFVKLGVQYRIRTTHVTLSGIAPTKQNQQLIRESHNGGTTSAIGGTWNYDSTNAPLNPKNGVRSLLSIEYAGLGGDHHFANLMYNNTLYFGVTADSVFRVKGNFQFIKTLFGMKPSHLPLDERLYLGGEQTVRGYKFNTVGPKFHDVKHTPRGGISSVLLSAEYDYQLFRRLSVFLFFDAGAVSFKQFHVDTMRYTTGLGCTFNLTETAPLVFGYGVPLNPHSKQDVKRFFFSLGTSF